MESSSSSSSSIQWDAANGVWVGNAPPDEGVEVPSPLVVFGYGPLCWRPGTTIVDLDTTIVDFESFPCIVRGW